MPAQYYAVPTLAGQAKIAAAIANAGTIEITAVAAGDGNGAPITPIETMTGLVHEVWRAAPASVGRDPGNPTQVLVQIVIPDTAAPATIRELALFTADGQCFAVANYPATDLAAPSQGAVNSIEVLIPIVVDTAASVTIVINPNETVRVERLGRAPFIAIDGFYNAPPAIPAANALVVVGAAPTGAFAGLAHRFAQWNGTLWVSAIANFGTVVFDPITWLYWRRTTGGWTIWNATAAEIDTGVDTTRVVVPQQFAAWVDLVSATAGVAANGPVKGRLAETASRYAPLGVSGACTGAANTYAVAALGAAIVPKALFDGMIVITEPSATNTGASTANVFGIGSKALRTYADAALAGGELVVSRPTAWRYKTTANGGAGAWVILPWANALSGALSLDNLSIYPEIDTVSNALAITATSGQVVIGDGGAFRHRGHRLVNTSDALVGARTFATSASKTYHLRWTWSAGDGFYSLVDVTAAGAAEANASYDSTYDMMLIAKVVTDAANAPTVTALVNKNRLSAVAQLTQVVTRFTNASGHLICPFSAIALNWARTPIATGMAQRAGYATTLSTIPEEAMLYFSGTQVDGHGSSAATVTRYAVAPVAFVDLNSPVSTSVTHTFAANVLALA